MYHTFIFKTSLNEPTSEPIIEHIVTIFVLEHPLWHTLENKLVTIFAQIVPCQQIRPIKVNTI